MRITRIDVRDFCGFPGPATFSFKSEGRNLAVYGENGSGKSSLFKAFIEFFTLERKPRPFGDFKNVFSDKSLSDGHVTTHFDDGTSAAWAFGADRPTKEENVAGTAIRLGRLDYRDVFKTHNVTLGDKVNLFDLVVRSLLAQYPLTKSIGGSATIGALWERALGRKPVDHRGRRVKDANRALEDFNKALQPVLPDLVRKTEELLGFFPGCDLKLALDFPGVSYDGSLRQYKRLELNLAVTFKGTEIRAHHQVLNEARLSAIALAFYFAGLLLTIPAPVPGAKEFPKLLVLDDVLIGLDMSNRIPVLDLLEKYFADSQIVLLTHDKVWFEIVRLRTQGSKSWRYDELYLGESQGGLEVPIHKPDGKGWGECLARARDHLAATDERAAAVYARAAFEIKIKSYCEKKGVWVKFSSDPRKLDAQSFWNALTKHVNEDVKNSSATDPKRPALIAIQAGFADIEVYRKVVLNPLSHSAAASIARAEIQGAIDAVEKFGKLLDG